MSFSDGQDELVDITSLVVRAASSLTYHDPLLRNPDSFSLQDAMAALEVTDPKMDCCELPIAGRQSENEETVIRTVPPRKLPCGLRHPLSTLPWDDLTLGDARIIALEAMTRLHAVLSGAGAAESTYTCLYAHDSILEDMSDELSANEGSKSTPSSSSTSAAKHVVYASALLLVKLNELVRTIALNADIYEEEDFTLNTQGFLFAPKWDANALSSAVNMGIAALKNVTGNDNNNKSDDAKVLSLLLQFQMIFFKACTNLSELTAGNVRFIVKETKTDTLEECLKKAKDLHKVLPTSTAQKSLDDTGVTGPDDHSKKIINASFDPYLCRGLMGNTPVRKVDFKSPSASLEELIVIVSEMDWAVCDLILKGCSLARIKRMLEHVSVSSVNVLSRSLIVLNLYFDDLLLGQYDLATLVEEHMHQCGGVPQALTESDHCKAFAVRLGKPIYDTLKVLSLNRNRQHAYIDALVMKEWPVLQQEATALDYLFRQELGLDSQTAAFITNYVTSITVGIMEHYLCLSIELGLLRNHHDLAITFWYWAFLSSTRLNIMTVMRKAKVEQKVMAAQIAREREGKKAALEPKCHSRSKKKGKKAGPNNKRTPPPTPPVYKETKEDVEDNIEFMVITLKRTLCRGIVRYIAALDQAGLLETPEYEFTSHTKRFQKRFESFAIVTTPPPLSYIDFEQGYSYANVGQEELISSATECFKASKTVVDSLLSQLGRDDDDCYIPRRKQEVMNLAKVCVGNSLFLHKLSRQVQNGGKAEGTVSFDFQPHNTFCTIKLT